MNAQTKSQSPTLKSSPGLCHSRLTLHASHIRPPHPESRPCTLNQTASPAQSNQNQGQSNLIKPDQTKIKNLFFSIRANCRIRTCSHYTRATPNDSQLHPTTPIRG